MSDVAVGNNSIVWPSNRRAFYNSYLSPLSHNLEVCQGFLTFLCCCQGYLRFGSTFSALVFSSSSSPSMEIVADFIITFGWYMGLSTKARPLRRRMPASSLVLHFPSWAHSSCSFYRRLSECEFVSCSCRRLCLHSLQLEDMPQFLAR